MRPRKKDRHLPKCLHLKHSTYYFVKKGVWEPLAKDYATALEEYAKRVTGHVGALDTEIDEAFEYIKKRPAINGRPISKNTVDQYTICVAKLKKMLRQFDKPNQLTGRSVSKVKNLLAKTPNMGNRVLSVLRLLCGYWLEQEKMDYNPTYGIKRHSEKKRTRLISEPEFRAIYDKSPPRLQIMLDLWRLTGQRVVDVIRIKRADLLEEGIYFKQEKTTTELIVKWNPELRMAVERAKTLYGNVRALTLFGSKRGSAPSYKTVYIQWRAALKLSQVPDAQIRDMRAASLTKVKNQHGKKAAQGLGGHKREATTERYLRDREIPFVDGPSFGQVIEIDRKNSTN